MVDRSRDREHLTRQAYATDEALSVRIRTHTQYTQPRIDFPAWVLDHHTWRGDETVLDIGCGAGLYVEPVRARLTARGRLLAADLSLGMLRDLRAKQSLAGVVLINADAMALPFADACCDVVLANHVLFHVPDITRALLEIRRVLRPGGRLLATTNARDSMDVLRHEATAACRALGSAYVFPPSPVAGRFDLENGAAILAPVFPDVACYQHANALVFPDAEPAVAFASSWQSLEQGDDLPDWGALMAQLRRQIEAKIAAEGAYRVPKTTGVFVASRT